MHRIFLSSMVGVLVLSCTVGFCSYNQEKQASQSLSSSGSLFAARQGDFLSVDIKDAVLEEVLRKLADQTGISFSVPPSLCKERLMVRFANFDIDQGIDKILAAYNRIFIYDQSESTTEVTRPQRLREVRIYLPENNKNREGERPILISASASAKHDAATGQSDKTQLVQQSPKKIIDKSLAEWSKDLREGNESAKMQAIQGLARIGGADAVGPLTSALEDANPAISREAENALTDIYASMAEENANNEPAEPIEGAPSFAIDSTGIISGNQMDVDIRLSDVPEKLITSGFMISYDSSQMNIVGVDVYDGSGLAGPWDSEMTNKVENPSGPGTLMVVVGNLGSVAPDENNSLNIARLHINCTGNCDAPITVAPVSGFDTNVGNSSTVYDGKMPPTQFKIN